MSLAAAMIATNPPFRTEQRVQIRGSAIRGVVKFYRLTGKGFIYGIRSDYGDMVSDIPSDTLEAVADV